MAQHELVGMESVPPGHISSLLSCCSPYTPAHASLYLPAGYALEPFSPDSYKC